MEKAYGNLVVEVRTEGTLYLDGEEQGQISSGGTARIIDLEVGSHQIEMNYDDGGKEVKEVTVSKNQTLSTTFIYVKKPMVSGTFVLVEAGMFQMGSKLSPQEIASKYDGKAEWYEDEIPVHAVTINRSYSSGR